MNVKKISILIFIFSLYNVTLSKQKNEIKSNNIIKKNTYNLENIKSVFGEYFKNIDAIIKNEKTLLKEFISDAEIATLSDEDFVILIIYRSLIPSINTMYTEIIKIIESKELNKNSNKDAQDKNFGVIFKKIEDLLYEYTFQNYIKTIQQYAESKKNKNTEYKILIDNVLYQIESFIKIFLNHNS